MNRAGLVGGLTREGVESFAALLVTLDRLADEGRIPPCRGPRSHLWTSDDREEREAATHACAACPIRQTCQAHAPAESDFVWGGLDRTKADAQRRSRGERVST